MLRAPWGRVAAVPFGATHLLAGNTSNISVRATSSAGVSFQSGLGRETCCDCHHGWGGDRWLRHICSQKCSSSGRILPCCSVLLVGGVSGCSELNRRRRVRVVSWTRKPVTSAGPGLEKGAGRSHPSPAASDSLALCLRRASGPGVTHPNAGFGETLLLI